MRKRNLKTVVKTMTDEDEAHLFEAKRAFERLVDPNVGVDPYHDVLTDEEVDQRNFEWRVRRAMTPERYAKVWLLLNWLDEHRYDDEFACAFCGRYMRDKDGKLAWVHDEDCLCEVLDELCEQLPRPGEAHEG